MRLELNCIASDEPAASLIFEPPISLCKLAHSSQYKLWAQSLKSQVDAYLRTFYSNPVPDSELKRCRTDLRTNSNCRKITKAILGRGL